MIVSLRMVFSVPIGRQRSVPSVRDDGRSFKRSGRGSGYGELCMDGPGLPPLDTEAALAEWLASGAPRYGVNVAAGQLDDDVDPGVITGPGPDPQFGPHVRAWKWDGLTGVPPEYLVHFFYIPNAISLRPSLDAVLLSVSIKGAP